MDNHNTGWLTYSRSELAAMRAGWFTFGLIVGSLLGAAITWWVLA